MTCIHCSHDLPDEAAFCQFCGAPQGDPQRTEAFGQRRLRRSQVDRQVGGVCGGIARYFDIDPVFVRVMWVILTVIPGAILLGVIAYLVAWVIMPEADPGSEAPVAQSPAESWRTKRLHRSRTNAKIGGVCGGIAEYFSVDATAVRLLWIVLSIFPGAVICGVLTYAAAWFVMPASPVATPVPPAAPTPAEAGSAK